MSGKKTTVTNQSDTSAQTMTPNVPTWLSQPTQQMAGTIQQLQGGGAAPYTPGISNLQQQAGTAASGLTLPGAYGQASDTLNNVPQVQGQSVLDNLSAYENPFASQVMDPVLQQYDYQAGQTRAAQAAQAAAGGAFGGSRYGVQEANTEGQLAMGRASTQGGLLNQMYTQATGLSAQDAANRQAAETSNQAAALQQGGLLTGLGASENAANLSNIDTQNQVGAGITALQNTAAQYPLQFQNQMESLLQGLNPALYTGQSMTGAGTSQGKSTTSSTPGAMDIIGMAMKAASMFGNPFGGGGGGAVGGSSAFG